MRVAKQLKIPVRISHAHRGSSVKNSGFLKNLLSKSYRWIMKYSMRKYSTHKLACSDVAGEYFFGKSGYELIFNGIDLKKYLHHKVDRHFNPSNPRFITVGRLTKQKNPFKLLEIFKSIKEIIPGATLTYCGGGELRTSMEDYIHLNDLSSSINMLGISKEIPKLLQDADYFLLPSLFEGLSIALVEAQSSGLDCFISDTCSKLSDCGKCIFIPLKASPAEWADVICQHIIQGKHMELSMDSLKRFDITNMTCRLESIYLGSK